ncbi:MAG: L-seryl-tRNA(Sec) selenium transferase [Longimicrobiales bacterium]
MNDPRRAIPSVDRLLNSPQFRSLLNVASRTRVVDILRAIQEEQRAGHDVGCVDEESYAAAVRMRLKASEPTSLRKVINATGVVLHTNLGRAPLAVEAIQAMADAAAGYSNLEYDLESGTRGSRYDHCRSLLCELTGAPDALVVNNNAAALVLALNTLAVGREAIVSRGELVEIGGSFRVPEILTRSGARMCEVGATNRVQSADYQAAIHADSAIILKVHRSNFRMIGFTSEVAVTELAELAHRNDLLLLHDLGSGLLLDLSAYGLSQEPLPHDSLRAGADLVTMSGDKLLGGPQAGIILGRADLLAALRRNPMCRALRVDKLTLAALEATLRLYRDPVRARRRIPTLRMLTLPRTELWIRAQALESRLRAAGLDASAIQTQGLVGGGAFPDAELESAGIQLALTGVGGLDQRLRNGAPAIVARIAGGFLILDLRTVDPADDEVLERALIEACAELVSPS